MDENTEANEIFTSGMLQNLKNNWINIAIILAVLILIIIIVKIISRRIRKLVEKKISDDRIIIKKRTFTFTSVVSNLINQGHYNHCQSPGQKMALSGCNHKATVPHWL